MSSKTNINKVNFDLLFKNHPIPMWIYDLKTLAFLEVNDAAVDKYGYSRKKFLSMTLKDIRHQRDVSKKRPALQHANPQRHKSKSAKVFDVEITSHTINYNGCKAAFVIEKDITDQKLAEEKIIKLNRVYSVISDVNQAIVRIKNMEELFESVCNIAIERGGFIMAWIGMIDTEENKVKVSASSGFTNNYLKTVNIDLNDKKRSSGPVGLAIKTGKHIISNNIEKDKKMIPWRKDAAEYGYKSCAAFPIKVSEKVVGSFNLYSPQEYFFDKEEMKLLDEMAMDLSFALESIEKERKRLEAEEKFKITKFGIDHSQIGIYQIDEEGRIYYANEQACKSLGYTYDELTNMGVTDIDPTFSFEKWKEHRKNIRRKGWGTIETIIRRKDGTEFFAEVTINYFEYGGKKLSFSFVKDITESKKSQEVLRESEERFRHLFEKSTDPILLLNQKYFFDCNPAALSILQLKSKDEIGNKTPWDLSPEFQPDGKLSSDKAVEMISTAKQNGYHRFEWVHTKKDGSDFFVEVMLTPITLHGEEIFHVIWRDITERKRAEEELRKSREDLLKFFEDDLSADFISTPSGQILNCNKSFWELFGFKSQEEALAFPIEKLYPVTSDHNRFIDLVKKNRKVENFEGEYILPEGRIIYTLENATGEFDEAGKLIQIRGYIVDITNRKTAELELKKLSRAVEQSPVSVVITNPAGDIEYVNEKFCKVTGYSREELIGKNPRILKSGHQNEKFYEKLWDTILSGKDWKGEILNKKKNGDFYWESELISPLVNNEGDITHFVAVKEDITNTKNMVSELIKAKEKAESANKVKDAFIANISHEIRTPLNGIIGMISIIKESYSSYVTGEDKELFAGIDSSGKRIIRTIEMILNYSRLQTGEFPANHEAIELSSICESLVREFQPAVKSESLELLFENKCSDSAIFADKYSLTQSISNLIDNAIKYTTKGSVKVILYKNSNNDIMLDVKDSGIGMSEEYTEHIFEPYIQEEMGYGRTYEGMGLGLSLVKKYLELNNASICVKSKKEEGTTFTVKFKTVR